MPIVAAGHADMAEIKRLLESSGLLADDITPNLLDRFLVRREGPALLAVVGLELAGDAALLRSLAIPEPLRGGGAGREMVAAAETLAQRCGVRSLYLLTTAASGYFSRLGNREVSRDLAPPGIRGTAQFIGLCPSTSAFMVKHLEGRQ